MHKDSPLNDLENKFDLRDLVIDDIWIYPIIKQSFLAIDVFHLNPDRKKIEKSMNSLTALSKNMLNSLYWSLKNRKLKTFEIIISENATSRRKKADGLYHSIRTDFLYEAFPHRNILTMERPAQTNPKHHKNIRSNNIFYTDFLQEKVLLNAKISKIHIDIDYQKIKQLFEYLNLVFDQKKVEEKLKKFFSYIDIFQKFLEKTKPKLAIINNSYEYSVMALIYACKNQGIKTVEFQHGYIFENHPGYIYKQVWNYSLFPDYIFTYGDYFSTILEEKSKIFDIKNIKTIGFPFIEQVKNEPANLDQFDINLPHDKDIILLTSQWTIRHYLKEFVIYLLKLLPGNFILLYKTHPREQLNNEFYKEFNNHTNVYLISNRDINSLDIMKIAKIHTTVYSTSLFESLYMGLPNILVNVPGHSEIVKNFVDDNGIFMVNNPAEYIEKLEVVMGRYTELHTLIQNHARMFFEYDSQDKMKEAIEELLNNARHGD